MSDIRNSIVAKVWVRFFHLGKTYGVVVRNKKKVIRWE